jgi:hypothetical protein
MKIPFRLKTLLDRQPMFYLGLLRLQRRRHWSRQWVVERNTEIVIEGFPRSGNSFAYSAFKQSNPHVSRIATHVHMSAQILMAARYGIPTMVLLREPVAAVCSMMALSTQIGDRSTFDREVTLTEIGRLLDFYSLFYRRVHTVHSSVVFAPFTQVTEDFGKVIASVNERYAKNFVCFNHDATAVKAIFEEAPIHLGPRPDRNALKDDFMVIANSPELKIHRQRAVDIYHICNKQCP